MQKVKTFLTDYKYEFAYLLPVCIISFLLIPRPSNASEFIAYSSSPADARLFSRLVTAIFGGNVRPLAAVLLCLVFVASASVLTVILTGRAAKLFTDKADFAVFAAMFYACPLFVTRLFYGTFFFGGDAVLLLLALSAVCAVRRGGNAFLLTAAVVAAELIDERFIFEYYPAVLTVAALELSNKKLKPSKAVKIKRAVYTSSACTAVCFGVLTILNIDLLVLEGFSKSLLNILISLVVISPLIITLVLFWLNASSLGVVTRNQALTAGLLPLCVIPMILLGTGCARALFAAVMAQFICAVYLILTRPGTVKAVGKAVAYWRARPLLLILAILIQAAFILFTSKGETSKLYSFLQNYYLFY